MEREVLAMFSFDLIPWYHLKWHHLEVNLCYEIMLPVLADSNANR